MLVIDANSLIHRAYHALPPLSTPKGEMVNAVYGFFSILFKVVKEFQPDYVVAAFDAPGPTERHKKFKEYKAKRVKAPDELYAQIPLVKEALEKIGVKTFEQQGYEADDFLGTVAKAAKRQAHPRVEVIIVSGDQDAFQLIDERTKVYTMRKGLQDTVLYDKDALAKRFEGLGPEQMIDFKALRGDPSDNIPGVPGIGEKTALHLLKEFGSLESVYQALEAGEAEDRIKPNVRKLLSNHKKEALLGKELVTINKDIPIDLNIEQLGWRGLGTDEARATLESFGFSSLLKRLDENGTRKQGKLEMGEKQENPVTALENIEQLYRDQVFSKEIYELEKSLMPILRAMEKTGIKIDKLYFQRLAEEMEKELGVLRAKIHEKAGKEFNINSTQQLGEVLFRDLEIPVKGLKKTPKGVISIASPELEKLRGVHPIVEEIFKHREIQKLLTTYAKPLPQLADERDRVHTHFDQLGAATGRLSSSNPNLQNIPNQGEWGKRIRRGFIAEQGFSLVSFDYSQMELRIAAHLSGDEQMSAFFRQGADIHQMTASTVFGVTPQEVTPEMRFRAKALNFGVLYGMGAQGFARSAGIPAEDARSFIEQYFVRFPKVLEFMEQTKEFARKNGYVETMFGRRRYLPEVNSSTPQLRAAAERMAINHPIQGTLADLVKMAMVKMQESSMLLGGQCFMLLQIHDELLFEIADGIIQETSRPIAELMENIVELNVPLEIDVKKGKNWADVEKILL